MVFIVVQLISAFFRLLILLFDLTDCLAVAIIVIVKDQFRSCLLVGNICLYYLLRIAEYLHFTIVVGILCCLCLCILTLGLWLGRVGLLFFVLAIFIFFC